MWYQKRGSKYGAKSTQYEGQVYDSKKEAAYAQELDLRLRAKDIKGWDKQVKVELHGKNGTRVCNYYVDFLIHHNDGTEEYVEVKGFRTAIFNLKWKLFEDEYGDTEGVIITMVT